MSVSLASRDWRTPAVTGAAVILAGGGLAGMALAGEPKTLATILLVLLFGAVTYLCGNPRLLFLWCLMLTIPLNLSKYFTQIVNKGSGEMALRIEICDPFIVLLALYLIYDIWTGRKNGLRVPKAAVLWMMVMFMGVVTVYEGPFRTGPELELLRMTKVLLLFLVIANELKRPRQFLHCCAAITLSVLIEAVIGVAEYIRKANLGLEFLGETSSETIKILSTNSVESQNVYRVSALLLHPNIFAIFLAALLPIAVACFLLRLGPLYKAFFLLTSVLGMFALIITLSRSGWVSFAAAFVLSLILMICHPGLRKRSLMATGAASIALIAVCLVFSSQIASRLFDSKSDASVGREIFKEDAKRLIAEKPVFGWGLATYVDNLPPFMKFSRNAYGGWLPPVHHIYYLWWAETGFVGLMIHLSMLGCFIWAGVGNLRVRNELLYAINVACLAALLAFMTDGFFSFSLRISPILRTFWVIGGMIMAIRYWRFEQIKAAETAFHRSTRTRLTLMQPQTEAEPIV